MPKFKVGDKVKIISNAALKNKVYIAKTGTFAKNNLQSAINLFESHQNMTGIILRIANGSFGIKVQFKDILDVNEKEIKYAKRKLSFKALHY